MKGEDGAGETWALQFNRDEHMAGKESVLREQRRELACVGGRRVLNPECRWRRSPVGGQDRREHSCGGHQGCSKLVQVEADGTHDKN